MKQCLANIAGEIRFHSWVLVLGFGYAYETFLQQENLCDNEFDRFSVYKWLVSVRT